MSRSIYLFAILLFLPIVFGYTCSDYFGDCSSHNINDAFPPCSGIEVGGNEYVNEVYIEKEVVDPNYYQKVTCNFVPTRLGSLDYVYIFYFNGKIWEKLYEDVAEYKYSYNKTISFNVGEKEGEKIVRCAISRIPVKGNCASEGNYYDNDDIKFLVLKPIKCNVSCPEEDTYNRENKLNCFLTCNKNVSVYYSHNYTEKNYTISDEVEEGIIPISFEKFPKAGKYKIDIFAKSISTKKIFSKEINLRSKAYISNIYVPEVSKKEIKVKCEVLDQFTKEKLDNYEVSFFIDGKDIGKNFTIDGIANFNYITNESGELEVGCSISDYGFYDGEDKKTKTVYITGFKTNLTIIETKKAEDKLKRLSEQIVQLEFYKNKEFEDRLISVRNKWVEVKNYLEKGDLLNFEKSSNELEKEISKLKFDLMVYNFKNKITVNYKIILAIILVFILFPLVYKILLGRRKLTKELRYYENKEKELIQKRKEIEQDYFKRKIGKEYFEVMLLENHKKLTEIRAKIRTLKEK